MAKDFQRVHSDLGYDARPNLAVLLSSRMEIEAGTNRSKGSASAQEHRCRSMMRGGWCRDTLTNTTTSD